MSSKEIESLLASLQEDIFVNQRALESLKRKWQDGGISDEETVKRLKSLEHEARHPTAGTIRDEWEALVGAINASERQARRIAMWQFGFAVGGVPLVVAFVLLSLLVRWHSLGAVAVSAVLTSCLATTIAHAFFAMRVQQQAGLAAERLAEKRVGVLFLKIAVSRTTPEESKALLKAGMKMFLGSHVARTVPLQPEDFAVTRKKLGLEEAKPGDHDTKR